jgi:hypothetical protein
MMAKRCMNAWCHAPAEPGRDVCSWCHKHQGNHADGSPRDPRHPWYQGSPKATSEPHLRRWFPGLVRDPDPNRS